MACIVYSPKNFPLALVSLIGILQFVCFHSLSRFGGPQTCLDCIQSIEIWLHTAGICSGYILVSAKYRDFLDNALQGDGFISHNSGRYSSEYFSFEKQDESGDM